MDSNTLKLVREALAELIEQCWSVEKTLTEEHHHAHYSGESLPLCNARQALAALDMVTDALKGFNAALKENPDGEG